MHGRSSSHSTRTGVSAWLMTLISIWSFVTPSLFFFPLSLSLHELVAFHGHKCRRCSSGVQCAFHLACYSQTQSTCGPNMQLTAPTQTCRSPSSLVLPEHTYFSLSVSLFLSISFSPCSLSDTYTQPYTLTCRLSHTPPTLLHLKDTHLSLSCTERKHLLVKTYITFKSPKWYKQTCLGKWFTENDHDTAESSFFC